jgi:hypothetical protein
LRRAPVMRPALAPQSRLSIMPSMAMLNAGESRFRNV